MFEVEMPVRYSEVDFREKLNIYGVINMFQDSSTLQSATVGNGVLALHEKNLVWVMSKWHVVVKRYPKYNEKLTVGTYPYSKYGFFCNRNYYMKDETGEMIAMADSLWILLNYKENSPARVTEEMVSMYPFGEKLPIDMPKTKILIPEGLTTQCELKVTNRYLDSNMHVNNAKYVEMALDAIGTEDFGTVRVEYRKQAHAGDILKINSCDVDNKKIVVIEDSEKETVAVMEFIND